MNNETQLSEIIEKLERERNVMAKALAESSEAFMEKIQELSIVKKIGDILRRPPDKKEI